MGKLIRYMEIVSGYVGEVLRYVLGMVWVKCGGM